MEKIITEKKTTELTIPKQLNGLLENVSKVAMAQKPTELKDPLEFLVLSKDKLEDIKDDFKAKIAEYKASLEQVEDALEELEKDIKNKALELLEFKEEFKTDKNGNVKANALGEIELTREHNLPTNLFSYTPPSTAWVVNEEQLLANPEKYKEFVKLVPTIDKKALKTSPNLFDLPRVQKTKDQSISIQGKLIIEKIKIKELSNEQN